jgi:hypothetical protein
MFSIQAKLEQYCADNKLHNFENERGIRNMKKVMREVCGYGDGYGDVMTNFFSDNPGAIEAVITWIGSQGVRDWDSNLTDLLGAPADDEESSEVDN